MFLREIEPEIYAKLKNEFPIIVKAPSTLVKGKTYAVVDESGLLVSGVVKIRDGELLAFLNKKEINLSLEIRTEWEESKISRVRELLKDFPVDAYFRVRENSLTWNMVLKKDTYFFHYGEFGYGYSRVRDNFNLYRGDKSSFKSFLVEVDYSRSRACNVLKEIYSMELGLGLLFYCPLKGLHLPGEICS